MSTSSWTLADLAALESAIAKGVKIVEYDDKKVTYRTLDEMKEILKMMKDQLCPSSRGRLGHFYAKSKKGLC